MAATAPDDAIRARRKLTNKLIAARDAARLRPFFTANAKVIPGNGGLIVGADAIVQAFAEQFRQSDFKAYLRTTDTVELDDSGQRAAETGHWAGNDMSGTYLAVWRKVTGQWVIEAELFITLSG
jgi:ketosteroid isomerase-like protein